ncbi:DUF3573 domain-containing protein [Francisella sp. Scap27]|uniref:rhizoferrin import outer membrane protein FslE n=1 Tax=Francisella sp. Scap27 TaxID=2589986 RepID=UPI0015BD2110|nr:rhizoferrin import outer membrane protein FslE [Francisella sp. Scap27]QLE79362.1 DUF3573 domain-containing protein [Francisella sp. Scap27]
MSNKLKALSLGVLGQLLFPSIGFSIEQQSTNKNLNDFDNLETIKALEIKIKDIQSEINKLQHDDEKAKNSLTFSTYKSRIDSSSLISDAHKNTAFDILTNVNTDNSIINLGKSGLFNKNRGVDVANIPAITTMGEITFLGAFSGNNRIPIGMISSNLFASTLIGQRYKFDNHSIVFGARIGANTQAWSGSNGITNGTTTLPGNGQNIYLTAANLYFVSNLGHYVTAQFDFSTTELNNFSLGNALVIIGNLDTSPFFFTVGKNKLSIGAFGGGGTWTGGMTKFLAAGNVTNVSFNYKNDVLNTNIAVFGSDDNRLNFSAGLFYAEKWSEDLAVGFNTGYVYNLAEAGNSSLNKFLKSQSKSGDTIGSLDINTNLTYTVGGGFLNIGAGWASTTNKKDFDDTGSNVLAGGWYAATNYSFVLKGRKTNFGASYGQSYNASNIPMPISASPLSLGRSTTGVKQQFILSSQRAYFDNNVLVGPEYVYQELYDHKHMNTVTLNMNVYI